MMTKATPSKSHREESPLNKAVTRSLASFVTWFVTEYPKLLFQQQQSGSTSHNRKHPLVGTWQAYCQTPWQHHVRGALSSAAQRGSSAYIMFYGQAFISHHVFHDNPSVMATGLAGGVGGGLSALIHSIFEPIKIRHQPLCFATYQASVWPMMWRHALFDGSFFATSSWLQQTFPQSSYATQFGVAALVASTVNLTHDVWKTQYIQTWQRGNPRLRWWSVVQQMTWQNFRHQLGMKATDLGFNWWLTGLLYAWLFVPGSPSSSS